LHLPGVSSKIEPPRGVTWIRWGKSKIRRRRGESGSGGPSRRDITLREDYAGGTQRSSGGALEKRTKKPRILRSGLASRTRMTTGIGEENAASPQKTGADRLEPIPYCEPQIRGGHGGERVIANTENAPKATYKKTANYEKSEEGIRKWNRSLSPASGAFSARKKARFFGHLHGNQREKHQGKKGQTEVTKGRSIAGQFFALYLHGRVSRSTSY